MWKLEDVTIPVPRHIGDSVFSRINSINRPFSLDRTTFGLRSNNRASGFDHGQLSKHGPLRQRLLKPSQFTIVGSIGRLCVESQWKIVIPGNTFAQRSQRRLVSP